MFSLSNDNMKKPTDHNPFAAFVPDAEAVQKSAEAWMKAMPFGDSAPVSGLAAHPMAAAAATTAMGLGVATQVWGYWLGSMSSAMGAAERVGKAAIDADTVPVSEFPAFDAPIAKPAEKTAKTAEPVSAKTETAMEKVAGAIKEAKPVKAEAAPKKKKAAKKAKSPAKKAEAAIDVPVVSATEAALSAEAAPAMAEGAAVPAAEPVAAVSEHVAEAISETVEAPAGDFVRPAKVNKPEQPDDLKLISGVGPKLEQVLNSLGVWTFAQIAAWTPQEIAWVDDFLQFSGRIERDDWLRQADALARGGSDEYVKIFGKEPR